MIRFQQNIPWSITKSIVVRRCVYEAYQKSPVHKIHYIPSIILFERKIFNSVVAVFFLFLKEPWRMTRRLRAWSKKGRLYFTCVGTPPGSGSPQVASWDSSVGLIFHISSKNLNNNFLFTNRKNGVCFDKIQSLLILGPFFKKNTSIYFNWTKSLSLFNSRNLFESFFWFSQKAFKKLKVEWKIWFWL